MVIMRPDAKKIPDPIYIDLSEIVRTSTLVNFPGSKVLPSMPLIRAAITDQAKAVAKGTLVPTNLVMGHGTKVVLASNDQLAKTVGQVGTAALPTVGSVAANVSSSATTVVNNLLGSGPAVSVSSSTQLLSLLSNAAPSSSGTITITPAVVNAGASVAVAPTGAVNVPSTGSILPTTLTGAVPTLLGQTPVSSNPTRLVGTGSLLGQGLIAPPPPGH